MQPNLLTILKFRRNHGSNTEKQFINGYLLPMIESFSYKPHMDEIGNIWVEVSNDPFLFVAHIDTCHRGEGMNDPIVDGDWVSVNPKDLDGACLGADDGVGIYCNLKMIEAGIGGTYLFTRGEEKGGIGASFIAEETPHKLQGFNLCVEVDRAGEDEIIVSQGVGDCASEQFAKQLASQLSMGHKPSDLGVYTDNAEFAGIIPECVNIAAGYYSQHTLKERVNLRYVDKLLEKLLKVDWSSLIIKREAGEFGDLYGPYVSNDYWDLRDYVIKYPERAAHFLDAIGVEIIEIESEWTKLDEDDYGYTDDNYMLAAGMY